MIWQNYRSAYEGLKADVARAVEIGRVDLHERAVAALDAFVASVTTDPRKLRAIGDVSPAAAAEIRSHADTIPQPRTVLDPVHDTSFARLWAATLGEEQMRMLQRVLADEVARRRRDSVLAPAAMVAGE
jgi:hypothetical protein